MSMIDFTLMSFQGRLVDDPVVKTTEKAGQVCKFTVASNKRISKDKEKTCFIPVTVFGRDAINCGEYLSRGRGVYVSGEFETDKYVDDKGIPRTGFGVVAHTVTFGPGGSRDEEPEYEVPRQKAAKYIRGSRRGR